MHKLDAFSELHYDKRRKAFYLGKQSLRGIHQVISECFYPSYTFERATVGAPSAPLANDSSSPSSSHSKSPSAKRKMKPRVRFARNADKGKGKHELGMLLGSQVDQQLTRVTDLIRTYPELQLSHFLTAPKALSVRLATASQTTKNRVMNCRRALRPQTKRIIKALHDMKLVPVESQVVVCNEVLRMGTAVDLVCRHQITKKFVVLEIKCGYDSYYNHHTIYKMNEPFSAMNDAPANQHQIQLGLTASMFCRVYGFKVKDIDCWVIRSHSRGVSAYPLASWVRENLAKAQLSLLKAMKQHEHQKQREA